MNDFDQLVSIKNFREGKAEREVRLQRAVLAEAQAASEAAERRLREYREYATEQERRLYQELCERPVRLGAIDDVRQQALAMQATVRQHHEERVAADQHRDVQQQQLDAARQAHAKALRMRDKFVELAERFAAQARADAERLEEAEIEESVEARQPAALSSQVAP